jgi:hypothetical protein
VISKRLGARPAVYEQAVVKSERVGSKGIVSNRLFGVSREAAPFLVLRRPTSFAASDVSSFIVERSTVMAGKHEVRPLANPAQTRHTTLTHLKPAAQRRLVQFL